MNPWSTLPRIDHIYASFLEVFYIPCDQGHTMHQGCCSDQRITDVMALITHPESSVGCPLYSSTGIPYLSLCPGNIRLRTTSLSMK